MSNSFPNMICNEPPPLDQSEEEDDDSEEIRNFSSGLKFDIDPSPMSTPQKSAGNTSSLSSNVPLPISNGISTPDLLPTSLGDGDIITNNDFDFTDSRTCCFESETMQESWIGNNSNTKTSKTSIHPMNINTIMKTSYIGTMESEDGDADVEMVYNSQKTYYNDPRENGVQVQFDSDANIVADSVDDFADFSESVAITSQSPPPPSATAITLQNDAISFTHAQHSLPQNELKLNSNDLSSGQTEDDFDEFQEFQAITTTASVKEDLNLLPSSPVPTSPVTTTCPVAHLDNTESDNSDLDKSGTGKTDEEQCNEKIVGSDQDEIELSDVTSCSKKCTEIENQSHPIITTTSVEEVKFEDAKSDEGEREALESEATNNSITTEVQIEQEVSCNTQYPITNLTENVEIFEDADTSLPTEVEVSPTAQVTVDTNTLDITAAEVETCDTFDADFGDFATFDSNTPFESFHDHSSQPNLEREDGIPSMVTESSSDDVNPNAANSNSPSTEKCFELTDNDVTLSEPDTTPQSQLQSPKPPTLLPNNDPLLENSSSSNFHSFSDDDDFDDFQAFQSTSVAGAASSAVPPNPNVSNDSSTSATVSVQVPVPITAVSPPTSIWPSQLPSAIKYSGEDVPFTFSRKGSLMEDKFENLVKTLFVERNDSADAEESEHSESNSIITSSSMNPIDKELKENDRNEEWNRVEDFEGSQGLLFKWNNSIAYQRLLQSLKIDNSTIFTLNRANFETHDCLKDLTGAKVLKMVYSGKWGAIEVPRFAASLVDSPLLPVQDPGSFKDCMSPSNPNPISRTDSPVVNKSSNGGRTEKPTASVTDNDCAVLHQNQTNSGMEATINGGVKPLGGHISAEAEQILNQLPDLSFMRAKTLVFPSNTLQSISRDNV